MERKRIRIIDSPELIRFRLKPLIGWKGIVTEDLSEQHRTTKGVMAYLDEAFLGEYTWFIPLTSIVYED